MMVFSTLALGKPVLNGYDVVEYQNLAATDNGVLGSAEFAANLTTGDKTDPSKVTPRMADTSYEFYFKNAANRDLFNADPWKYAPAWGGF